MKKIMMLILLVCFIIIIAGCHTQPELRPLIIEPTGDLCLGKVSLGDKCANSWRLAITNILLDVREVYYEKDYQIRDDDKTICSPVQNSSSLICEPKMINCHFKVNMANITYKNNTVDCYLINDTCKIDSAIIYRSIMVQKMCSQIELFEPNPEDLWCDITGNENICELR
jgi:hypothetical protein